MQRIVLFLIAILTMSTIDAQTLTERQKGLAACACLMAQGDMNRLEPAVRMALDKGVTINELKEAFSQLYAYTGFPRSLNALGVLSKVLENKQPNWQEGKPWKRPAEWDDAKKTYELGTKNQTQLSGKPFNYTFCPQDDYYLKSHLFGDIFAGDQLSAADREIVTVAALSGLEGVAPQLAAHKQVQVLICVAGRGWYQEWGKAPVEMTPGSVIAIPAEVKHWHGAQKDSWFQHLTYHKDVQEDASNEWCESVADEVYDTLK